MRQGAGGLPSGTTDRVELSGDAALRLVALKAANEVAADPDQLVDRMRHKLNAGKVGNDSVTLADAIIDDLDGLLSERASRLALKTLKLPEPLAPEDRAAIRGQVEATRQRFFGAAASGTPSSTSYGALWKRKAARPDRPS